MASNLIWNSGNICVTGAGHYALVDFNPEGARAKDISIPNSTGKSSRILGMANSTDSVKRLVFTGVSTAAAAVTLNTLLATLEGYMKLRTVATLQYAQPHLTGAQLTLTNMMLTTFKPVTPHLSPTYQPHLNLYAMSWLAVFERYEG